MGDHADEAEAIAQRLPTNLANRATLQILIRAIPIERIDDLEPMARRLREIGHEAFWLRDELGVDEYSWDSDLAALSPIEQANVDLPDWKGLTGHLPLYSAVMGLPNPTAEAELLRALLLCALVEAGLADDSPIRKSHIATLAAAIRGIDRDPLHYYRSSTAMLGDADSAAEASVLLLRDLPKDSELRAHWARVWHPILTRSGNKRPAHRRRETSSLGSPLSGLRTRLPQIAYPLSDPLPGEPPEDYGAIDEAFQTRISQPRESVRRHERADLYRSRSENHALLPDHIEVLSISEFQHLRETLQHEAHQSRYSIYRACSALLLTQASLSIDIDVLAETPIVNCHSERPEEASIAIEHGTYWQPCPRLPNQHIPDGEELEVCEPVETGFALPLPPTVTAALNAARIKPGTTIKSKVGDEPASQTCQKFLATLNIPWEIRKSSRLRRFAATHVMDAGNDFAAVQIIFGDAFGRSNGHLYYVCFDGRALQTLYAKAIWPLFGDLPAGDRSACSGHGCGPSYVPRTDVVRAGFRFLSASLNRRPDPETASLETIARWHNRYTASCAYMIAAGSGHRPVGGLFHLQLGQIDWHAGYIVGLDKQVDISHITRPIALPTVCAGQIRLYLDHLAAIANNPRFPKTVRKHIEQVMASKEPVWTFLSDNGKRARKGVMTDFRRHWPDAWRHLPPNWYRHYLATHLRRAEAPPLYVMMQLGHLGSSGQPLAADSPISPMHMVAGIRAFLDTVAEEMGMRARQGYSDPDHSVPGEPPPANWSRRIDAHLRIGKRVQKAVQDKRRADGHSARRRVAPLMGPTLARHSRELARAHGLWVTGTLVQEAESIKGGWVNDAVVEDIIHDIDTMTGETRIDRLALMAILRDLLRDCAKLGMRVPRVHTSIRRAGGDLAPLLTENADATRYMHRLRDHLKRIAKTGTPITPLTRAALATLAYELPPDLATLYRMLCGSLKWLRPRKDLLLRIAGPVGEEAMVVSGLASIGYRHLHNVQTVSLAELNDLVAGALPADLRPEPRERTLEFMISIGSVAARFEQSGIVRLARDPKNGSVLADAANLEMYLLGKPTPATQSATTRTTGPQSGTSNRVAVRHSKLREQYKRLRLALSHPDHILTGSPLPRGRIARTRPPRPKVIKAVEQVIGECGPTVSITQALAQYVREMLVEGTQRKRNPKISTIETYLSEVGPRLIEMVQTQDLQTVSAGHLEDAYLQIVEDRADTKSSSDSELTEEGARCAQQVIQFQHVLERLGGPAVDLSQLGPYLSRSERRIYCALLSEADYEKAKQWLQDEIAGTAAPDPLGGHWRTQCRHSCAAMILLYRSGARIDEVAWLRLADIQGQGDNLALSIRVTRYRGVKTPSARRRIVVGSRMTQDEHALINAWLAAQRAGRNGIPDQHIYAFSAPQHEKLVYGDDVLRDHMQSAFRAAGKPGFRPHTLRHAAVNNRLMDQFRIPPDSSTAPTVARSMQRQVHETGHARPSTTIRYYCHVPLGIVPPSTDSTGRWHLAMLADKAVQAIDLASTRHTSKAFPAEQRLRDRALAVDTTQQLGASHSGLIAAPTDQTRTGTTAYTVADLDQLIRDLRRTEASSSVAIRYGLRHQDHDQLIRAVSALDDACHYRILPLPGRPQPVPLPRRGRHFTSAYDWGRIPLDDLHRMGELFGHSYRPFHARLNELRGEGMHLRELEALLLRHKLAPAPVRALQNVESPQSMAFGGNHATSGFSLLCWFFGLAYVHGRLSGR